MIITFLPRRYGIRPGLINFVSFLTVILLLDWLLPTTAFARKLHIAIIDSGSTRTQQVADFKEELNALFAGEHDLIYTHFSFGSSQPFGSAQSALAGAYRRAAIDHVVVLDLAANQLLGLEPVFQKPTYLPIVLSSELLGYPRLGESSGKENLSYLAQSFDIESELAAFQSVTPFKDAILILPSQTLAAMADTVGKATIDKARNVGVSLKLVPFDGSLDSIANVLPEKGVVLYGALPNREDIQLQALVDLINAEQLPSYSLSGEAFVKLGALATNTPDTDWRRIARRTALNIQEVERGGAASALPVTFEATSRLIINMKTADLIRVAPSYDVLSEAVLINEDQNTPPTLYSLAKVAQLALETNLSIAAQRLQAEQARARVKEVRGGLLPRIDAGVSYDRRRDGLSVQSGFLAQESADGTIQFSQPLFNEDRWAAFKIEKYNALNAQQLLRETELDIIQTAVNAYLNILLEQTSLQQERYNLQITNENFRLAKTRVDIGDSDKTDLYRWESELANAKQGVLQAKSRVEQRRQQLNSILNRPIAEPFSTSEETLENPELLMSEQDITSLIRDRYSLRTLTDFFVQEGLKQSPEIKQVEAQIEANQRQLRSDQRAYWVPDLDLTARYNNNIYERRNGGIPADQNDWNVGVELSIPLFEGGARSARTTQSRLAVRQGQTTLRDIRNTIEQEIRSQSEATHASYQSIALAKQSEDAAQRNFDLLSDTYNQGQLAITNLLDAQETLLDAREASMNATYSFLIDLMNLQRAAGSFDFFLTSEQRLDVASRMQTHMQQFKRPNEPGATAAP